MLYKLCVTVPEKDGDRLRKIIGDAGAGKIGNYSHCSFTVKGTGRFVPTSGAKPAIGEIDTLELVAEERIEVNCSDENLQNIIDAIRSAHPYEEPVSDIYTLLNP